MLPREKSVLICPVPACMTTTNSAVPIIISGLNLPSHAIRMAVKPSVAVFSDTVWEMAPAYKKPITPQMAPDNTSVRMITFFTLIPTYFAVLALSPTTAIS